MTSAELIARSVCYLARWRIAPSVDGATARLHPGTCAFCGIDLPDLATTLRERPTDATEWARLSREARFARIREAGAMPTEPWWQALPAEIG